MMKDSKVLKEELLQGKYESLFLDIYQDENEAKRQNTRYAQAVEKFEELFEEKIADFFELLTTDKRFIMLEDGYWDLKEFHNPKVVVDDEEDDLITNEEIEEQDDDLVEEQEDEDDIFYDTDTDDDLPDDDLEDLVVIDVDDEEANS